MVVSLPRSNEKSLEADRARALDWTPVSRETAARLDQFVALLRRWQKTTNLVAPSTLSQVWTRHVADSIQLLPLAPDAKVWIDLGAGGGFPGMVIACALADVPGAQVHLVESNAKKAAFLREAARVTGAPALIHNMRIEDFARTFKGHADIVTARALAPLDKLIPLATRLMGEGTIAVFPKGQDVDAELTLAAKYWNIEATLLPSRTDPKARIVVIRRAVPLTDS